jgi:transposase
MTIVCELGDIRRFEHPPQLTSYVGLDVAEYSPGGKERKMGITKTGNKHVRTILTELCQLASSPPILSKRIKLSRKDQPQAIVDIADRCMNRS